MSEQSGSTMNNKNHILRTGEYKTVKNTLNPENINILKGLCRKLKGTESRPLYIVKQQELGSMPNERYLKIGISSIIREAKPILEDNLGDKIVILSNKALIRRTWPMSEMESREIRHNASNLTWHQDSNAKHNDKPMVVMMINLDKGFGETRPGISLLKTQTENFKGIYGYQGERVEEFETTIRTEERTKVLPTENPVLDIGEMIIFNGLTFHRTYSTNKMVGPRDALLVRAVSWSERGNFPKGPHLVVKCRKS